MVPGNEDNDEMHIYNTIDGAAYEHIPKGKNVRKSIKTFYAKYYLLIKDTTFQKK